eukprot:jgi/Psemu1/203784/e_gw1.332.17.1
MASKVPSAISDKKPDNDASKKQTPWGKNKNQNQNKNSTTKKFQRGTTGLKDQIFYYGKGMNTKWLTSREKLLNYIGKKYSMSKATSIKTGTLTLIGITKPDAIEDKKVFKALHFYKQEEWKLDMKRYNKTKSLVNRNLSSCYALIWGQLTITLRNKVKADPDYVTAMTSKNAIELFKIVTKICNKTSTIDHEPTTVVSSLYSIISLNGGNMPLSEYYEHFVERCKSALHSGFDPTLTMIENYLTNRSLAIHGGSKSNAEHVAYVKDIKIHATNQFFAIMFLKQSGERFEECCRSLNNDYTKGTNHIPATIDGALAEDSSYIPTGQSEQVNSKSHQGFPLGVRAASAPNGEQHDKISTNKTIICYKCGREGHISPQCTHSTTIDGDTIEAESESRPYRPKKSGTTHVHFEAETERVSLGDFDFEDELEQDDYFHAYQFIQHNTVYTEDMRGNQRYCLNMKQVQGRLDPFWVLIDNQSTVHIFWNEMFLVNVRKTDKTLDLHTNAGQVTIDEIGELPGVGTVWLHQNGIANILSFHALQHTNNFEIDYSTRLNKSGIRDKAFRVETPEGSHHRFLPDGRGLYYLDCSGHFGCGKTNTVFGTTISQKSKQYQPASADPSFSLASDGIVTIQGTKEQYANRDVKQADEIRRFQHIASHPSDATLIHMIQKNVIKDCPFVAKDVRLTTKILGPSVYAIKGKRVNRKKEAVHINNIVPLPRTIEQHYSQIILTIDVMHINRIPMLVTISRNIHYGTVAALPNMKLPQLEAAIVSVIKSYSLRGFHVAVLLLDKQFDGLATGHFISRDEHVPEIERFIRVIKERCRASFAMLPFNKLPKRMIIALAQCTVFYINAFPWPDGVSQELSPLTIVEGRTLLYNLHFQVIFGEYAQTYEGTDNTMNSRTVGAIALGPSGNLQGGVRLYSLLTGRYLDRAKADYNILPMPAEAITRVHRLSRRSRPGLIFGDRHDNAPTTDSDDDSIDDDDYVPTNEPDIPLVTDDFAEDDSAVVMTDTGITDSNEDAEVIAHEDIDHNTGVSIESDDSDVESTGVDDVENTGVDDVENTGVEDDNSVASTDSGQATGVTGDAQHDHDPFDADAMPHDEDEPGVDTGYRTSSGRHVVSTRDPDYVYSTIGTRCTLLDTDLTQEKIRRVIAPGEYQNFTSALEYIAEVKRKEDLIDHYVMTQMSIKEGLKTFGDKGKQSIMKEINNLVSRDCFGEVDQESLTTEQKRRALPILMFMLVKRDGRLKSRGCADGRPQRLWTTKQDNSSPTPAIEAIKKLDTIYGRTDPLTIRRGPIHEYLGMTIDFSTKGQVMITMYDYIKKLIDKLPPDM